MVLAFAGCSARHTQQRFATIRCLDCGRLRFERRAGLSSQPWPTRDAGSTAWSRARCAPSATRRQEGRSARGLFVRANWNAEIEWQSAKVVESKPAARGLQTLVVDVGDIAAGYKIPGQFVQIKVGDSKPGFYAIASPPDPNNAGLVELLIKSVPGTTAEILAGSSAGDAVDVSPVMGKGFNLAAVPVEEVPTLLLFATGSGIAPIRALIDSERLQTEERKDVRLYYGTFEPDMTAYLDQEKEWSEQNVKVINVYSNDKEYYVQDAFSKDGLEDGSSAGAIVIGQKEMFQAVSECLTKAGVTQDRILTNF